MSAPNTRRISLWSLLPLEVPSKSCHDWIVSLGKDLLLLSVIFHVRHAIVSFMTIKEKKSLLGARPTLEVSKILSLLAVFIPMTWRRVGIFFNNLAFWLWRAKTERNTQGKKEGNMRMFVRLSRNSRWVRFKWAVRFTSNNTIFFFDSFVVWFKNNDGKQLTCNNEIEVYRFIIFLCFVTK